jgi:Ras-related protein Rab-8A
MNHRPKQPDVPDEQYDHQVKLLMIGESGVGKTCIIQRFTRDDFTLNHLATIAIDFRMKSIEASGKKLKMQIWDTAGQERFNTLTTSFFKGRLTRI